MGHWGGTKVAMWGNVMKPWFVLVVLWAASGIVILRHSYAEGASPQLRKPMIQMEEPSYAF
jgi:hypothetical protein